LTRVPACGALLAVAALAAGMAPGSARASPAGQSPRIVILVSQEAPPYEEAVAGFRAQLDRQGFKSVVEVVRLKGDAAAAAAAVESVRSRGAGLLLTLGSLGTQTAVRGLRDVPIVAGMVLDDDDLRGAANATGVILTFPVETELRWLQRLMPGQKNIGVLFNPAENRARIAEAERLAPSLGLVIVSREVQSPRDLPDALVSMANRADVLWGVPDQVVLNPQTVKPILLFSLRNRIPFVGLSAAWVKAGALYALDRDYGDIGAQCAEIAARILQGTRPAALPAVPPRKVTYVINRRTLDLMKIDLDKDLLRGAQATIE